MKYRLYNKTRFLKNDEVVLDQEGNFLVLDDGDAPNHIRNSLDIDVLRVTSKKDKDGKDIIQGDILVNDYGLSIVDYYNDAFILVDLIQQSNGMVGYQDHHFGNTFEWIKENVERVGNICENERMKRFYRSVIDDSWQRGNLNDQ